MKLEWSPYASEDRNNIFDYLEQFDPHAAANIDGRIRTCIEQLITFPESGRVGRIANTRELVINRTPYIATYQINNITVKILRILHGSQEWPSEMKG